MAHERPPLGSVPPAGTKLYRGERGNRGGSSVGIHWSTSKDVAAFFPRDDNDELHEMEITDPEKQVVPYGALRSAYFDKATGRPKTGDNSDMQGLPNEREIRLRPGAVVRSNGRDVTVDNSKGGSIYTNLHEFAVTPEASNKAWFQTANALGHTQDSIFDEVVSPEGDVKGYIPKLQRPYRVNAGAYQAELLRFGQYGEDEDAFPTHTGRSMDQYVPPPHAAPKPHVVKDSPQFKDYVDVPLPGM